MTLNRPLNMRQAVLAYFKEVGIIFLMEGMGRGGEKNGRKEEGEGMGW